MAIAAPPNLHRGGDSLPSTLRDSEVKTLELGDAAPPIVRRVEQLPATLTSWEVKTLELADGRRERTLFTPEGIPFAPEWVYAGPLPDDWRLREWTQKQRHAATPEYAHLFGRYLQLVGKHRDE